MKALSIRQPWVHAILNGGKDIENRDWPTRFRGPVLLHAGLTMTRADIEAFRLFLAVRDLAGEWANWPIASLPLGGIVGRADIIDCVTTSRSPWFCGQYGFVLANAQPLPFRPLKGRLGFFDVEPVA